MKSNSSAVAATCWRKRAGVFSSWGKTRLLCNGGSPGFSVPAFQVRLSIPLLRETPLTGADSLPPHAWQTLIESARFASAVARNLGTRAGAQPSMPRMD